MTSRQTLIFHVKKLENQKLMGKQLFLMKTGRQ